MCELNFPYCCLEWKRSLEFPNLCLHALWTNCMDMLAQKFLLAANSAHPYRDILTDVRLDTLYALDSTTLEVLVYWGTRLLRNVDVALARDRHCAILCLKRVTMLSYDVIRHFVYTSPWSLRSIQRRRLVGFWEFIVTFPTHPHYNTSSTPLITKELGWH